LHPDLAFQLEFPSGWKTANQPSSVVGVSEKQDAQVALSLGGNTAPADALRAFLGQQGVTAGPTSPASIKRDTAGRGTFSAQNQDGTQLNGLVAYLSYNGTTYQLLGITTAAGWPVYRGAFDQFAGSFRRLTDQTALNVKPNRISIAKVTAPSTLAEF